MIYKSKVFKTEWLELINTRIGEDKLIKCLNAQKMEDDWRVELIIEHMPTFIEYLADVPECPIKSGWKKLYKWEEANMAVYDDMISNLKPMIEVEG